MGEGKETVSKIPIIYPVSKHPELTAAMCAIGIHEEAYLDEWVDYHYGLGFTAFYIYDNSPKNDLGLWSTEKGSHVTVKHVPEKAMQYKAYSDCGDTFGRNHTWVAFYDLDEYLVLKQHRHVIDMLFEYAHPESFVGILIIFITIDDIDVELASNTR